VAGIAAPHAGGGIDDLAAVDGKIMHVLGASQKPRRLLEGPVGSERHPVRGKVVGDADGGGAGALVQHGGLFKVQGVMALARSYQLHRTAETGISSAYISAQSGGFRELKGASRA
jgi:hypothetical protein